MAEVPSRLYEHLSGSAEEIIARLGSLGLLAPGAGARRDEIAGLLRGLLTAQAPPRGEGPPSTGETLQSKLQSALHPFLNDAGRRLAAQRPF